ncbi:Hypothetical protein R9X50_00446400 [Acrodontium crateriforme]|uniref:Pre-rRNA-processing protein IPI3 n=1 Tax=Acrodontium crateriforme TaxID=150365 RepID=A0AAQ3M815_9PEZI|nr:Hypothetical protein R9X50_00446400 [Acrodontium crateriforme]
MLTEQFVSSVGVPTKAPGSNIAKDAGIFVHEFQPIQAQRAIFKKSATLSNCLAVSSNHIFAAQSGKAVVHVYSREKGNQEAIVPFPEHITSLALACDDSVLVLGTVEGRIFLWETISGRLVTTSQAHLQAVTSLAVEHSSNFLLSASKDSTVHVWSIPALLSFATAGSHNVSPLRTFTSHRGEITSLALGHSASASNIAVSVAKDKTCLVWNYHTNNVLRTYLLPSVPLCLTLDPADRAIYVGYEDGSLQQLDLYAPSSNPQSIHNSTNGTAPVQPPSSSRWQSPDTSHGAALSISLSFDSSIILSGHPSGMILSWDTARGSLQSHILQNALPGPVNNVCFLPVTGFATSNKRTVNTPVVVKPKFGAFDAGDGTVPGNYTLVVEQVGNSSPSSMTSDQLSSFQQSLTHPTFPSALLDEGLSELAAWSNGPITHAVDEKSAGSGEGDDFMALDQTEGTKGQTLEEQNAALKSQIEALRRLQTASFEKIDKIQAEKKALLLKENKRSGKKSPNGKKKTQDSSDDSSD